MRVLENGVYRDMTSAEEESIKQEIFREDTPTTEERLAALEAAMLEQILGGMSNV